MYSHRAGDFNLHGVFVFANEKEYSIMSKKTSSTDSKYLTVNEVRDYLNISTSAAYGLVHRKDFPTARFGSSIRIPKAPFLAWVQRQTVIPAGVEEYLRVMA